MTKQYALETLQGISKALNGLQWELYYNTPGYEDKAIMQMLNSLSDAQISLDHTMNALKRGEIKEA